MRFPRHLFRAAFIYGLIALVPLYFLEGKYGSDHPPAVTHPEFYYGFIGVALAWQFAFLIVSLDPPRYRLLILPGILEKLGFGVAAIVLHLQDRAPALMFGSGIADLVWAALFAVAFVRLGKSPAPSA